MDTKDLEGIAIIGVAGRFPGAKDVDRFWKNLCDGVESITFFTDEELIEAGIDPELVRSPTYVKAGGILGDVDQFDAAFFGLHAREAALMDPQHRLFLECAWHALENAGYTPEHSSARFGVFAGQSMNTYLLTNVYSHISHVASVESLQASIGNDKDSLTTEVAYRMNFTGPAVTIQSSSSSSLVAIHYACQSLLNYETDVALAGGVSVHFPEKVGYIYYEGGINSLDGHCRAYDAKAQGFVTGNGCGVVALKRLEDALEDRDFIYAVIRGSASNNDGALRVSYMAPTVDGQAEVVTIAQAIAGVEPEDFGYIEGHGTGTLVGDPIEVTALTQAFNTGTDKKGFCVLGSAKPNIGHLDTAAGVTGLIKAALVLNHKRIPPTLHFESPNPNIDFENSPFYVTSKLTEWPDSDKPRVAGVSSFGMGGTNAHVVLQEAPARPATGDSRPEQLLLFSARSTAVLDTMTQNMVDYLCEHADEALADIAFTLHVGRKRFNHRRMLVCHDLEDALTVLSSADPERVFSAYQEPKSRPVMFMFSGQGSQYVNMGRDLYASESIFREHVDACAELLKPHLGLDLRDLLYPQPERAEWAAEQLKQTAITQPALFTIEYALAKQWMHWGITPQAMIGHSIGEYAAACLSGVFSLEDALSLVTARGSLMQQMQPGSMLSLSLSEAAVQLYLNDELSVAVLNTPTNCVLSGPHDAIDALQTRLDADGIAYRRLHTSHAFHSAMMSAALEPFRAQVQQVNRRAPTIPYISNVSGTWITPQQATNPDYWCQHIRQTVRFSDGIRELLQDPDAIVLEVGPGKVLETLARAHLDREANHVAISSSRHPREQLSDVAVLLNAVGRLWLAGVDLDLDAFYAEQERRRLPLPAYPFDRQRYWVEPKAGHSYGASKDARPSDGKKLALERWFYRPEWRQSAQLPEIQLDGHDAGRFLLLVPPAADAAAAEIAAQMARALRDAQHSVTLVKPGAAFARTDEGYTLDPQRREDYTALLQELAQAGGLPTHVVHLWGLSSTEPSGADSFEVAQRQGSFSFLALGQALAAQETVAPLRLTVVTSGVYAVSGDEPLAPEKAPLVGLLKVLPQEHAYLICKHVDVRLPARGSWRHARLSAQLLAECASAEATDPLVAYRGETRWTQAFVPLSMPSADFARRDGVYLIIGGLGTVGYAFAGALAKNGAPRLALLARTALPARDTWDAWLAEHPVADGISRRIEKVRALDALGAQVLLLSADVSVAAQMSAALAQIRAQFGALNGVIHAAGSVGKTIFHAFAETEIAHLSAQFQAKVQGLHVLEEVLRDEKLDFCLLTSSLSAIMGGLGLGAYAAANAFMDAEVQRHNQTSAVPWTSVDWDAWQLTAAEYAELGQPFAETAISEEEGGTALLHLLAAPARSQIAVSTTNLDARLDQWVRAQLLPDAEVAGDEEKLSVGVPRPNLQNAYVAPRDELEGQLAHVWQEVLGLQQVGVYDNFFELGGNSLVGVELIAQLKKQWSIQIPTVSLYEGPSVHALANIVRELQDGPSEEPASDAGRDRGSRRRDARARRRKGEGV